MFRLLSALCFLSLFSISCSADPEPKVDKAPKEIALDKVDCAGLQKAIEGQKGKIVLLDIWSNYCIPCKKKFPHVVQLQKDYAKEGLVLMTLSVDDAEEAKGVLEYLKEKKAECNNYLLNDTWDNRKAFSEKIDISLPPILHIFDRSGEKVKTFDGKASEAEIDQFVKEMVSK